MMVGKHGWKVRQGWSGNLDLKVVLSLVPKTTSDSLHGEMLAFTHTHTTSNNHMQTFFFALIAFSILMKWNKWRGGCDCASLPSDWMVIFIWVDVSSEVKNLTNKLATQFSPRGDKDTGVLSPGITSARAFCFHRHFWDTVMWGCSFLKDDVRRSTWIQLGLF